MSKKDGGPAYPSKPPVYRQGAGETVMMMDGESGMSLRDYFAAAALTGLLAPHIPGEGITNQKYADDSYRLADAMLARRE